jgi:protease-4
MMIVFPVMAAFFVGLMFGIFGTMGLSDSGGVSLHERYYSGAHHGADKIAVVRIEGVIMEGALQYANKQIETAANDDRVKAVVVRINSPGGSITASDDLHRRLVELRDGNTKKSTQAKPLVVSMGALAASGGYYIAMPASHLVAEPTTITGSIGVYAAFPNISKLAQDHGVAMEIIKAGDVKDSGSMFHEMKPQERQLWQDMVNHAYQRFLGIIEEGRPQMSHYWFSRPMTEELPQETRVLNRAVKKDGDSGPDKPVIYVRRRADGGIFTAEKAKSYGLIDQIGYLDDAVEEARKKANLGDDVKVVQYDRPISLFGGVLGSQSQKSTGGFDLSRLASGVVPRLWYLAPQSDLAGILTAGTSGD